MGAVINLPSIRIPDAARRKRLVEAWNDPELSKLDLFERGFTAKELQTMREEVGPKATKGVMPRPAKWSIK